MKKIIPIALLLISMVVFSPKTSVAQNTTFKLSDYKNPDYFYQTLDLNFVLNSASSAHKNDNSSDFYNAKSYSLGSNALASYSIYQNSLKSQSELYSSLSGTFSLGGQHNTRELENSELKQHSSSNSEYLMIGGLKRFYNLKQNYFEVNGSFNIGNNGSSNKEDRFSSDTITNSIKSSSKDFQTYSHIALLIGKGRIEEVQDARMALYLIEDMHQLNRDKRPASDEEVLELAKLITSLKYKRFFDTRLRKIAEITAIDAFMQQNGIAGTTDATYFTSLNDNWDFANNPARNSGWRIYTGVEGNYGYTNYKYHQDYIIPSQNFTENSNNRKTISGFIVAGLNYEKPISLKWQKSASVKARFGSAYQLSNQTSTNQDDINNFQGTTPTFDLSASYGYGYYPNSRTWLTAGWSLSSGYGNQYTGTSKEDKENSKNNYYTYTGPNVQAYYYLSEKLRLSLTFYGRFQIDNENYIANIPEGSDNNQTRTNWNHELRASLTYSLF
jgi:hypothetical protein